jgi:hypothetical protein
MCLLVCSNGYVDCYKLQIELEAQNYSISLLYGLGLAKSVSKIVYFYYHIASGVAALSDLAN